MGHRINVMIADPVWAALQQVPQHERNALISEALDRELKRRSRVLASAAIRPRKTLRTSHVSAEQLVRADRDVH